MGVRELASKIGISHSTLSLYENLKREPGTTICAQFARYFNVSSDYLLGLTDDPKRKE
jgi:transcriptional regulator with XRE-family HTH domain